MSGQVVFLESNFAGNAVGAIRRASSLGLTTHFVTRDPDDYADLPVNPADEADLVSVVDTYDISKLLRLASNEPDVTAVMAFDDFRVVQAAVLAEHVCTKNGPTVAGIVNARFKDVMRAKLMGTAYSVHYAIIGVRETAESAIGYPCVAKPLDESGSVGVRVCGGRAELAEAVTAIRAQADRPNLRAFVASNEVLVEEFIDGPEFSAELVWSDSAEQWLLIGYTRKLTSGPQCLEIGHDFPHTFDSPGAGEYVLAQIREVLQILELRGTLCHIEFRVRPDNRIGVVEVNPRPAGGRIAELILAAIGLDLVALHLDAHLGIVTEQSVRRRTQTHASIRYLIPARPGVITEIRLPGAPSVLDVRTVATPASIESVTSNDARVGQVLASGETAEGVAATITEFVAGIRTSPPGALA